MRTPYDKLEIGVCAGGLAAAAVAALALPGGRALSVGELLRIAGVMLLLQGFARDVMILLRRRDFPGGETRQRMLICVESTVGLLLIAESLLLAWTGGGRMVSLPAAGWLLLASGWWLFGWATRELVLELRRDPDHLNLLVGLPARR
ncbi:hypothetical protein BH23GEM4_BH23GEM4_23470 [soil metagenome]